MNVAQQIIALAVAAVAVAAQSGSTIIDGRDASGSFNGAADFQTTPNSIAGAASGTATGTLSDVGSGAATGAINGRGSVDDDSAQGSAEISGIATASNGASAQGSANGSGSIDKDTNFKASGTVNGKVQSPGVGSAEGTATGEIAGNLQMGQIGGTGTAVGCFTDANGKKICGTVNSKSGKSAGSSKATSNDATSMTSTSSFAIVASAVMLLL